MFETARLTVWGEPRAKQRPRVTRHGTYTPQVTREYEDSIRAVWDATDHPDMPECVRLDIQFYLGTKRHVDLDNLAKACKDALNSRAYLDDWQVHELSVSKFYTARSTARTEIVVYSIPGDRGAA
jgi:Holliday junction resolvase RusA-like endonuclease